MLFPDDYINNVNERLSLYNDLGNCQNEAELLAFEQKLIDRFGPLPKEAKALLNSIRIKWIAIKIGVEKLIMKQGKMVGYFVSDQQSQYYSSKVFTNMVQLVQKNGNICRLKEKETKNGLRLLLTFDNVKSINKALEYMEMLK